MNLSHDIKKTIWPTLLIIFMAAFVFITFSHAAEYQKLNMADPTIIQEGDYYYVFSTSRGIQIYRSKNLVNWKRTGRVYETNVPDWAKTAVPGSNSIWAPDISYHNGQFYLYYAVSTFGSQHSCIGLATNKTLDPNSPDYKWQDKGIVIESDAEKTNFNAIDAMAFVDQDNNHWITWGSYWTGIKLARLDPVTGLLDKKNPEIIPIAFRPETNAVEAPFIMFREGYYYLFVSFDSCCDGADSTYRVMVGRSKTVKGPYVDYKGIEMNQGGGTLVLGSQDNWRGTGHNDILQTKVGDFIVHHTYDVNNLRYRRIFQIRPVRWLDDGWPVAGEPITESPFKKTKEKAAPLTAVGKWSHTVNYDHESTLSLLDSGKINDPDSDATWTLDGDRLFLHMPSENAPGGAWIDQCILAPDGQSYIGRNQEGSVIRGICKE